MWKQFFLPLEDQSNLLLIDIFLIEVGKKLKNVVLILASRIKFHECCSYALKHPVSEIVRVPLVVVNFQGWNAEYL